MTEEPCTVDAGLSLADALDRMNANNIRHLLVTRGDRLAGIISQRDLALAGALPGIDTAHTDVASAMSDHVYVCDVDAPLDAVAFDMESHRYGCAIVLREGRAVGVFTTTDALRALRQLVSGKEAEPASSPTHKTVIPEGERQRVEHHVRVGTELYRAHVSPSSSQGVFPGQWKAG
jgi:acetoin utilization protein AcuB